MTQSKDKLVRIFLAFAALALSYEGVLTLGKKHPDTDQALILFVVATVFLLFAARGLAMPAAGPISSTSEDTSSLSFFKHLTWEHAYWAIALGIAIALAFVFRFYELNSKPYGIWFDEAQNGIVARGILHGDRPVFVSGLTQLPALFFYVFAFSLKLFGNNIFSLRLVSTAAGIGAVFFTYLLGRELFGNRAGVLAAFFLAVMRWHVNFSRFAMHGIFAPLFEVVALYFLVRGLKDKGLWNFAVAGIAVGIGLQSYYSFIILVPIIALFVFHHAIFETSMPLKRLAKGIVIVSVATVLVYAPMANWAFGHWKQFNERSQTVSITKGRTTSQVIDVAWTSARKHLLMFDSAGDRNGRHNIPGAPMLDRVTGLLFVLGFGYSLVNLRRSPYFLLVVWSVLALQGGIWSLEFEAPQAYRTVGITPAIALLAAVPLDRLWLLATSFIRNPDEARSARALRWASLGGVAATSAVLLLICARINFHNYFDIQLNRADSEAAYSTDATFVAKEMQRLGAGREVRMAAVLNGQPTINFLNSKAALDKAKALDWSTSIPSTAPTGALYLLDSSKQPFVEWLQQIYPKASYTLFRPGGSQGPVLAYEALISETDVHKLEGLAATYAPAGGAPVQVRETDLNLDWSKKPAPAPLPLTASWQGILRIPTYNDYRLAFDVPGSARMLLDGQVLATGADHLAWSGRLYKGDHELTVEADVQTPGPITLSLNGAPVPPEFLLNFPAQGHGLIASYYSSANWEGEPKVVELEAFIGVRFHSEMDEVGRPVTVIWSGFLDVPTTGDYTFDFEAAEKGTLKLDSIDLSGTFGRPVRLTQGRHAIEARLQNRNGGAEAFLYWTPPGGIRTVIPPMQLYPR